LRFVDESLEAIVNAFILTIALLESSTRTQAEEYLKIGRRLMPETVHQIVFDLETE
jgi:hypothetical protein